MIVYIIIKMHCKRRVQIYKASVQRAHGANTTRPRRSGKHRSVATTSPQNAVLNVVQTQSGVSFEHVQNKRRRMAC